MNPPASTTPGPQLLRGIEAALKLHLADRRLWVVSGCGLFITLMLSLVQARTGAFDTMQLLARLMLVVESTLLLTAWLLLFDGAATRQRVARALAGGVAICLQFAIQLLPLLILHTYPDLAKQGINVPLMLLQQGVLLLLSGLAVYHFMLGLRLQLRLPGWLAGPLGIVAYGWASLALTQASLKSEVFKRLNDLYYWNQLWLHLPDFPQLQTDYWIHRIETQWFFYYLLLASGLAFFTLILWLPACRIRDSRETLK